MCNTHLDSSELCPDFGLRRADAALQADTEFQRLSTPRLGESADERHERIARDRERYEGCRDLQAAARFYRAAHGLPEPVLDARTIEASYTKALRVAAEFDEAESFVTGGAVQIGLAYGDLVRQVDQQLDVAARPVSTGGLGVTISYVNDPEPYASAAEQADDLRLNRHLDVATISVWPDSQHPLLSNERGGQYDRFRAVHDIFGHACVGTGFDRHGEYASWVVHSSMFHGPAQRAASTELHGENSYQVAFHRPAPHKAILLPPHLTDPALDRLRSSS